MKKNYLKFLIALVLFIPILINAKTLLNSYSDSVNKANSYINKYSNRRTFLSFNQNYIYESNGFTTRNTTFRTGGLLSKSEYDLSVVLNQSYLANGKEFWTCTSSSNGNNEKYYIDAYADFKTVDSLSGTRVTQYIKPNVLISGSGSYGNPWSFEEGYAVDIVPNNSSLGSVNPLGQTFVKSGNSVVYNMIPTNGNYYNSSKDDCGLVKDSANAYDTKYLLENVNKDISCTAIFEPIIYKFNLVIPDYLKDYKGVKKTYTTPPNYSTLYYIYNKNWYKNSGASQTITSITSPTMDHYSFRGYHYLDNSSHIFNIIDTNGNISITNLNLGSQSDFLNPNHTLTAQFSPDTYYVQFYMNGGFLYGTNNVDPEVMYSYDSVIEIETPTKSGYVFDGWTFERFSSTARSGSTTSNVNNVITSSTKTKDTFFANLKDTNNGTVYMTAHWVESDR